MEHTALRPRPLPGRGPRAGGGPRTGGGPAHHPHAATRRRRRLRTLLLGACAGTLLVLSGVGIGAVGATVLGGEERPRRTPGPRRRPCGTAAPGPPWAWRPSTTAAPVRWWWACTRPAPAIGRAWPAGTSCSSSAAPASTPPPTWHGPSPAPAPAARSCSPSGTAAAASSS
ncbi:hypothetical protein GPN2_21705 [Streptomyces murinus]